MTTEDGNGDAGYVDRPYTIPHCISKTSIIYLANSSYLHQILATTELFNAFQSCIASHLYTQNPYVL